MSKKKDCTSNNCCEVEAVVSFDERGQLVIPKDVRKKFKLEPGEKFALISCMNKDGLCCFSLIKTSAMSNMVQDVLGPAFTSMT